MKRVLLITTMAIAASCLPCGASDRFYRALNQVEASGRSGAIVGDNGKALGPYQIHRSYWQDSGVPGDYGMVTNEPYARRVVSAYLKRYAPDAVRKNDYETMARVHNGGPQGYRNPNTLPYWRKVRSQL